RIVDTVLTSTPRFIANREAHADSWKREKLDRLVILLLGAIRAAGRAGLMMNVPRDCMDSVLAILPALATPTVSALADEDWLAVNTVVEERSMKEILPRLREAGARGIVEYPLSKIID
ncbi:MAG: ATP phosphoribosyltransferase, partial [Myxococcota bacterium]